MSQGRILEDWLDGYVAYTKNTEPPRIYHPWVGLSTLAAALGRKVYTNLGFEILYPNLYIALIGPSGCRKSTAIRIGRQLMQEIAGIKVGAQATTREALIMDMARSTASYTNPDTGIIAFHNSFTQVASELHVFLKHNNIELLANLADWYDCETPWEYRTKHMGIDIIEGLCLNLLAASAPQWIPSMFPVEAIGGGPTARFMFIVASAKAMLIPDPILTKEQFALAQALTNDLAQINLIAGEYVKSPEAKVFYAPWYIKQGTTPPLADPKFASYCERRGAHIHKLSMIVTASRTDERIIQVADVQRAISILEIAEQRMEQAFSGVGESRYINETEAVLRYFTAHGRTTNQELMAALYRDVDPFALTIVLRSLSLMGRIKIEEKDGDLEVYTLTALPGKERKE